MKSVTKRKTSRIGFYTALIGISIFIVLICVLPINIYTKHIAILTLFYAYMGTAWNIMCGYTGRISLGHSAFVAIGAYTSLILFNNISLSPWLGMLLGGLLAVGVMLLIAYPCFRFELKGPYFTLASIAVMEIVQKLLTSMRELTGGSLGMSLPYVKTNFLKYQFDGKEPYLLVILAFWLVSIIFLWKIERTRYYLEAIREDDDAASALGISVDKNLILAASISAFMVAIGGTFYVQYYRYIDPSTVGGFNIALNLALVTIIGGSGTIFGPTVGAALMIPLSEILRTSVGSTLPGLHLVVYGIVLIIIIIYLPKGVVSIPGIIRKKRESKEMRKLAGDTHEQ